ncbi:MAG: hypothetical protein DMG81_06980 [Acidobacteria bacterium]|nr:MAG: hypothetical protein DMG81_06980 [Acidobacteriota bacterium]
MLVVSGLGGFAHFLTLQPAQPVISHAHQHAGSSYECCHSVAGFALAPLPVPVNMPCGNQHSCCIRQAPNSSSLPTSGKTQHPDSFTRHPGLPSYEAFSTVLRI